MPNSILSAYQFSLLMGTLLFLEAISLYGENTFTSVENQCLLIEKTLTFVQTTAMGWQQLTGCSSPFSSSPQCSFLLWVSSTILQTFFQALSEDPTSNQNGCPPSSLFQVRTYTLGALRYDHKILWSAGGWSSHCGICFVVNCSENSAPQGCCSSARWRRPLPRTTTRRSRTSSLLAWVGSVRSFAQSFHDNYDHGRDDWDDWSIMGGRLDWGSSWRRRSTTLATWSTSGSCSYKVHHNSYHESWS